MPDNKDYISNTYNAIKDKVEGFNRTPEEYRRLMSTDSKYRQNVYNTLKEKVEGFGRTPQEFDSLVIGKPQKEVAPKAEEKFGPLPAQTTIAPELPSFQQQVKQGTSIVPKKEEEQGALLNIVSSLDRGFYKNLVGSPIAGLGLALEGATGKGFVSNSLIKFGNYFNKTIDELAPQDEKFKNTLADQFGQAFGQVASLIVGTGAASALSKGKSAIDVAKATIASQAAPKAVGAVSAVKTLGTELASPTAVSAGLSMGKAEFDRAKEAGASDEQAFESFYKNAAVGSVLEKIPVMQFMKRFNQATAGGITNYIKTKGVAGFTGGLEEMTTEILQGVYSNATAKEIYDANQNIFEGIGEAGGVGFGVGFLLNAMGANAKILRNSGREQDASIIENQVAQLESQAENGGRQTYRFNGTIISSRDILSDLIDDMSPADLVDNAIEINNDPELTLKLQEKIMSSTIRQQVIQGNPDLNEPSLNAIADLEIQLRKLEGNTTQTGKDKANAIRLKIKDIEQNQLQEEVKPVENATNRIAELEALLSSADKNFAATGINSLSDDARLEVENELKSLKSNEGIADNVEDEFALTVLDMMDKPIIINGERATLMQEGQTVVAKVLGKERVIEVGNIDEIGNQKLSDVGLTQEESAVTLSDAGNLVVRGTEFVNLFTDPLAAINRNANGDVVSVNLETADGKKRTFRGATADDVAYQIILKKINENNETRQQFEDFVEASESIKQELESGQVAEVAVEAAPVVTEQVPVVAEKEVAPVVEPTNEVERLRAAEQKELLAAIPNIEQYKVDGVVDESKITDAEEKKKYNEIYAKYDKLITPLLEPSQAAKPVEVVEEQKAEEKPSEKKSKEVIEKLNIIEGLGGMIKFAEGVQVPFKYNLIESEDVKPSHLPSGERNAEHTIALAQPKERGDIQSKLAQEKIAASPNLREVGESPNPYFGAPVVNARGEVIQGNNRSLGLKRHYNEGGTSYKKQLAENAEKFGMTSEQVNNMKNPILVRQSPIDDSMAIELGNYDVKDLETGGKQRIDPITTVRKMTTEDKNKLASLIFDGEYSTVKEAIRDNQQQVGSIISKQINAAQRNTIFDKEGNINPKGMEDIENIVNNMLFESGPAVLPEAFNELSYIQQKNIQKSIKHIFNTPEGKSILPEIQNAVLGLYDFRKSGIDNFNAWLSTIDIFQGNTPRDIFTPVEIKIMETLAKAKNQSELAKQLSSFADLVKGKPADMFEPERVGISKQKAINKIFNVEYENIAKGYAEPEGKATDEGAILAKEPELKIARATPEESADFNNFSKRELEKSGFDAEYKKERVDGETKEQYLVRKYCK